LSFSAKPIVEVLVVSVSTPCQQNLPVPEQSRFSPPDVYRLLNYKTLDIGVPNKANRVTFRKIVITLAKPVLFTNDSGSSGTNNANEVTGVLLEMKIESQALTRWSKIMTFALLFLNINFWSFTSATGLGSFNITVVSSGGSSSNWSVSGGILTASANVSINSSDISGYLQSGNLVIDAAAISLQDSITATAGFDLTLKSTGNINVNGGVGISTSGGDITFQSDSDESGSGSIRLGTLATDSTVGNIKSNGGGIFFSGGSDTSTSFARASTDIATGKPRAGIAIYGFNIDAGGGNIVLRGHGGTQNGSTRAVLIEQNNSSRAKFTTSASGSIQVVGDGSTIGFTNAWGIATSGVNFTTENGNISWIGTSNTSNANARGFTSSNVSFTSTNGAISLTDTSSGAAGNYTGAYFGAPTTFATNDSVTVSADEIVSETTAKLTISCNTATISAQNASSFTATPSFGEIDASNCRSLNLGQTNNASNITISKPVSVGGDFNLTGASVAINDSLTVSSIFSIAASETTTQTARMTADKLKLTGNSHFYLAHSLNSISTLSAGTNGSRIKALAFQNSQSIIVGSSGSISGIYATDSVTVSTTIGDISVQEAVSTTKTSGDALFLYANRGALSGSVGNGNVKVSGNGIFTIEGGSRALIYSGSRPASSGLVNAVGGESNTRSLIDTSTVLVNVSPTIGSTGMFALFRTDDPSPSNTPSSSSPACSPIVITSLSPSGGTSSGGTRLTITGSGLTSSVHINGRIADVRLSSSNAVTLLTPAGTKGAATVRIDGCANSSSTTYLYDPDPVISSLSTISIATSGGVITITGSFLSGASITIGTTRAAISSNTDALITASLPPSTAGEKVMTLTTPFGSTTSKLTYLEPPSLAASISSGYIAQGDAVNLSYAATGSTSYSASGILPHGLSFNTSTGALSGIATKEGIYNFSITASNAAGSDSKNYTLDIDRPTPKALNANLYFASKITSLSPSNRSGLDRLIAKVNTVAPRNLSATITMAGGAGNSKTSLTTTRHEQIKRYLEASGIKVKSATSTSGNTNKVEVTVTWMR